MFILSIEKNYKYISLSSDFSLHLPKNSLKVSSLETYHKHYK